jgi:hypothetical protein
VNRPSGTTVGKIVFTLHALRKAGGRRPEEQMMLQWGSQLQIGSSPEGPVETPIAIDPNARRTSVASSPSCYAS